MFFVDQFKDLVLIFNDTGFLGIKFARINAHLLFILGVFMENDVFRLLLINGTTVFVVRYHVTEVFDLSLTIYFVSNV